MKIPKRIDILGVRYRVEIVDSIEFAPQWVGMCDYDNKKISLVKSLEPDAMLATLLHEINHAIIRESGVHQALSHELNEVISEVFSRVYTKIIKKGARFP